MKHSYEKINSFYAGELGWDSVEEAIQSEIDSSYPAVNLRSDKEIENVFNKTIKFMQKDYSLSESLSRAAE